jgi:hypothetical protein
MRKLPSKDARCLFHSPDRPMLGDRSEPFDAGRLEADVGIEPAGDSTMDDSLFLFVQERDQLSFSLNHANDFQSIVVKKAHD